MNLNGPCPHCGNPSDSEYWHSIDLPNWVDDIVMCGRCLLPFWWSTGERVHAPVASTEVALTW